VLERSLVAEEEQTMPEKRIAEKARKDKRAGKAPSTQAGEFVHEEIRKIRRGEHGARSPEQAIAIGLSEARRASVALPPPKKGRVKESTRRSAEYAYEAGQHKRKTHPRPRVARAVKRVLEREPRSTASRAAAHRTSSNRSAAARKAAHTKGAAGRSAAARKAARTRARRAG
jgi:hypothetical protein